jgi:hypothetical protein
MHDAFGNDDSLARAEVDGTGIVFCGGGVLRIDEIDEQTALDDVEELVLPLMVVPVIVSLNDAEGTTESFTLQSVSLYQGCGAASAVSFSSITSRGLYLVSRIVR